MPTVTADSLSLYYETDGAGPPVVFVPEAGLGGWSWGWQHAALAGPFETVVWDLRGTGRSDLPPEPAELETLAEDLEAILSAVDARRAHVVGAGLGGAVALAAARRSRRIETLALFGTAADGEAFDLESLFAPPDDRTALRESLAAALSPAFRTEQPDVVEGIVDWRTEGDASRPGFERQLAALDGFDATDWLVEVTQPTVVVHGTADELVPVGAGRDLASGLPRGAFELLDGAGHLAFVERSRTVNDLLFGHFERHGRAES